MKKKNLYIVTHDFKDGYEHYHFYFTPTLNKPEPSLEDVLESFKIDFDPERESLNINNMGHYDLKTIPTIK